jgi:nicotinate-nucleotide pyrophosphorylase (carboxylating)
MAEHIPPALSPLAAREAIRRALAEDIGTGDITSALTVAAGARARAELRLKKPSVIAGLEVAEMTFRELADDLTWECEAHEGEFVGDVPRRLVRLEGPARAILSAERTALNFIQRLSGIASSTRRMVDAAQGKTTLLDTRKTVPGLRALDKYAVAVGGGRNHRFGLFDGVLIKENHIRAAGGISAAVGRCRGGVPMLTKIEVEVTTFDELREALDAGADVVLLDNMSPDQMRQAVEITAGRALLEASGGVTPENLTAIAATGVDFVSSGALTHSVEAADISLLVEV